MTDAQATETDAVPPSPPADDALIPPTFDVLPLSPETRAALAKMGYDTPTPVQRAVFEPASRGKDLVVQARTGTGKTTAFGLPIVDHSVRRSVKAVQALCLCPTRELALQVAAEIGKLGEGRGIVPVAIYGGAPMGKQVDALAAGAQVVVGTPGRVLDHLRRGTLDPSEVRTLVLDEADEMLSMGFERELTAILDLLPKDRQTLLFSATLPPDIERMARERLKEPEFVTLSGDAVGALSISHYVYFVTEDKAQSLIKVVEIENPESAVVFCNTKVETEAAAQALQRAGYDADWLNGDMAQSEREEVMGRTRQGKLRFLVATDVAARGIDISHLTHVINYDFPDSAEAYVHRTGRTGRAGRTGTAISLVRPKDIGNLYLLRLTYKIRPIERQIPTSGEMKTRREADLTSMVVEAFSTKVPHPDDLLLARRLLTHDRAEAIVAGLLRDHLGERQTSEDTAAAARRAKLPSPPPERRVVADSAPRARRERERPPPPAREEQPRPPKPERLVVMTNEPVSEEDPPTLPRPGEANARPREPQRERGDRRDRGPRDRGRPREDRPVQGAVTVEPIRYTVSDLEPKTLERPQPPRAASTEPRHHRELANWHPPEEEGDDRPILAGQNEAVAVAPVENQDDLGESTGEGEGYLVVYVDVGRRDGVRPADFQRILRDRGGISRRETGRIRVRDKHALISVKKEVLARAIEALTGAEIGGRTARAEQARDRSPEAQDLAHGDFDRDNVHSDLEGRAMTDRTRRNDPARLQRNVENALRNSFALRDVLPMLEALSRATERGSPTWLFAQQKIAELLVESQPWRAAVAARVAAAVAPEEDGSHALLGLALTLLGHYRSAAKAYRAALAIAPANPWYAHNLGHLLDVALDSPREAVSLLKSAHALEPHVEIAASYAHALGRAGRPADGKRVLLKALGAGEVSEEHQALLTWLEDGAPAARATSTASRRRGASQST